jgi:hypothetical protein
MNWQTFFRTAIRVVFLFAFVAFLSASVSHIAVFFNNFEADKSNWVSPYMLAISIDLTSLVLTIGVMFFRKDMPWFAVLITWVFIVCLTAFSWVVNWEYARTYQGINLEINPTLEMLNPILASSFAFLNLAYSFVSEFFNTKTKTAQDLQDELNRLRALEDVQNQLKDFHDRNKKPSIIQRVKVTVKEAIDAVEEVFSDDIKPSEDGQEIAAQADVSDVITSIGLEVIDGSSEAGFTSEAAELSEEIGEEIFGTLEEEDEEVVSEFVAEVFNRQSGSNEEVETDPEMEAARISQFHRIGSFLPSMASIKEKSSRRKPFTVSEAAEFLQCSDRHVRDLRKSGTLVSDSNGMVTAASVKAYDKKRKARIG